MNEVRERERLFKAVGSRRRLTIVQYLRSGRKPVGDIANHLKLSIGATSRHLSLLAAVDVVDSTQEGLVVYYFLIQHPSPAVRKILDVC